jgi:hypothetical protein
VSVLNQCATCEEDFASVDAFDQHILSAPSDPSFDCMQVSELEAKGWRRNERGRWSSPRTLAAAQRVRHHREGASGPGLTPGTP